MHQRRLREETFFGIGGGGSCLLQLLHLKPRSFLRERKESCLFKNLWRERERERACMTANNNKGQRIDPEESVTSKASRKSVLTHALRPANS